MYSNIFFQLFLSYDRANRNKTKEAISKLKLNKEELYSLLGQGRKYLNEFYQDCFVESINTEDEEGRLIEYDVMNPRYQDLESFVYFLNTTIK